MPSPTPARLRPLLRRSARTAPAAALLLALSACGGAAAERVSQAAPDAATRTAVERAVQACMRSAGFEYVPSTAVVEEPAGGVEQRALEDAATLGYGISTTLGGPPEGLSGGGDDPNAGIRAALPASEQNAYDRALIGTGPDGDEGCLLRAAEEVGVPLPDPVAQAEQAAELELRLDADAEVVEARRAWSQCMRDAGYGYARPSDALQDFLQRVGGLAQDSPELLLLQGEERATAQRDAHCSQEHLADVERAVRARLSAAATEQEG